MTSTRMVVVSFDGATLALIERWIAAEKLPTFARLLAEGARAELLGAYPMGSAPARPVWNVAADAGKRVAVSGACEVDANPCDGVSTESAGADLGVVRADAFARQRAHVAEALALVARDDWDLGWVSFPVLDQVQRRFWHFMDSSHSAYPGPNEFGETILEFHQILDEALAEIVNLLDDRMGLLLVSEHGTRALETYFAVTSWLETSGFLAMKDEKAATPPTLAGIGAEVYALLRALRRSGLDWLPKIVSSRVTAHALPVTIPSADLPSRVDWAATRVFCPSGASGGVRVNLRGREPHGIVAPEDFAAVCEEVRAALVALVDPATGRHVVRDVHRHHAIASGTFAADAADLLIETADGFGLVEAAGSGPLAPAVTSDSRCTGQPARAGMIVLAGPMARRGAVAPALDIRDVTRTLLHLLGLPTPADPDGAIATSVLAEAHALTIDTDRSADLATRSLERTMEGPGFL